MRVLKLWIVVVSTPSFCLAASIWSRFCSMRSDRGAPIPGQRQHEVGHQAQGYWEPEALLHFVVSLRLRG